MTETPETADSSPSDAVSAAEAEIGLDLPAWKVWLGTVMWLAGVAVGTVAIVMSVRLHRRWDTLADPSGDITMVVIRWVVAALLLVIGILLATANGRARSRAARETLRLVS